MPREYVCGYGNCDSHTIKVTVTTQDHGTQRYCSELHAAASLAKTAFNRVRFTEQRGLRLIEAARNATVIAADYPPVEGKKPIF